MASVDQPVKSVVTGDRCDFVVGRRGRPMNETIKSFLQQPPPRHVTGSIMQLVVREMRNQRQLMQGMRLAGLMGMTGLLYLANLPEAWREWQFDQGEKAEVTVHITGSNALTGMDAPLGMEGVTFDYPLPDGTVGRGQNLAPIGRFRKGQTAIADVMRERPELVRLHGANSSTQGSSSLWLVPAFLVLLPVGWWFSFWVVFREEKWWLRHAHWVEARVVYDPEGKSQDSGTAGYYRGDAEVEAHYDFEDRAAIFRMHLSTAGAEALAAKGRLPLLVLPTGKEFFEGGRKKTSRVTRPDWIFRAR